MAGQTAVVTGASSGLGRAIALRLAAEGATVILGDRGEQPREGGRPTAELIAETGGDARFLAADVSRAADNEALVAAAVEATGRLDVLVANAGIGGRVGM